MTMIDYDHKVKGARTALHEAARNVGRLEAELESANEKLEACVTALQDAIIYVLNVHSEECQACGGYGQDDTGEACPRCGGKGSNEQFVKLASSLP